MEELQKRLDDLESFKDSVSNTFDTHTNKALSILDNKYLSATISIILIIYASMAAPQLPENIARLFENMYFKAVFLFLIAYNAKRDPTVSLIATICIMVSLQTLNKYDVQKEIKKLIGTSDQEDSVESSPMLISVDDSDLELNSAQGAGLNTEQQLVGASDVNEINVDDGIPTGELMGDDGYVGYDESDTNSYETI